jgi:hypothetical protein
MKIPIMIEKISEGRFRAGPLQMEAYGKTPEEAVQKLLTLIDEKIAAGSKLEEIEFPG